MCEMQQINNMCEMQQINKANRRLELFTEINENTATKLISELRTIINEDEAIIEQNEKLSDAFKQPLEPVEIYFNSPGGSVIDGCAILSIMEEVEAPIIGHIIGTCGSMAVYLFLACDIRTGTRFSQIAVHGVGFHGYGGLTGYSKEIDSINKNARDIGKMLDEELLLKKTKMTKKELEKTQTCLRFFNYKECIKYKFFTHDIYSESAFVLN